MYNLGRNLTKNSFKIVKRIFTLNSAIHFFFVYGITANVLAIDKKIRIDNRSN